MPNSYDGMGLGARSFAMGATGAACQANIENIFYNPAGIAFVKNEKIQIEALFVIARETDLPKEIINMQDRINLGFKSFSVLQKQGAISWRTLSSNEFEISNGSDWYKKQESIKALTISAGNKNENGTAMGINISYLYGTLSESSLTGGVPFAQTSSGNGFAVDIGFMYPITRQIVFGTTLENVAGFMWWGNYDFDQLPFGIRTGFGYSRESFNLLLDWNKKFYRFSEINDNIVSLGLEQYLNSVLCIRAGAQGNSLSDKDKLKYTYGFGLNISEFSLSVGAETYKLDQRNVSKYLFSLKVLI